VKSKFLKMENVLKFALEGEELLRNNKPGQALETKCSSAS